PQQGPLPPAPFGPPTSAEPPPEPVVEQPAEPDPEPSRPARAPKFARRSDGGFGPMGSSPRSPGSARLGYGRNAPQWTAEELREEREESSELRSGFGYRSEEGGGAMPQFLVEA